MKLISIILSFLAERYSGKWQEGRQLRWIRHYFGFMERNLGRQTVIRGRLAAALVVALPMLLVGAVYTGLLYNWGWLGGLLAFLFGLFILILSLGPIRLDQQVKEFIASRRHGNDQAAVYQAQAIIGNGTLVTSTNLTPEVIRALFLQTLERYFAVFFWYAALGPVGAVMIRLLHALESWAGPDRAAGATFEKGFYLAARDLRRWLEWPVARVLAIAFGLSGSFVDFWQQAKGLLLSGNDELLTEGGFAALRLKVVGDAASGLQLEPPPADLEGELALVQSALDLVKRALMFGLALLAILTLYGLLI